MAADLLTRGLNRRDFLRLTAGAAAVLTVGTGFSVSEAANQVAADSSAISLDACIKLTPAAMAERSAMVKRGYAYLLSSCDLISNAAVRSMARDGLQQPKPKLLERYPGSGDVTRLRLRLQDVGYAKAEMTDEQLFPKNEGPDRVLQAFSTAPGSGWKSHHPYPGGLVTHVAVDLKTALGIYEAYQEIYGYRMNKELIVSAILLHDIQKTWVLQWKDDGTCLPEANVAGTGVHHILGIADTMYRDAAPELVVALACSHNHPGFKADEAQVVDWIKAAAIIAGKDPVREGYLASDAATLPLPRRQEGFMVHLGDHDYVMTAPAAGWMTEKLSVIARQDYRMTESDLNGLPFNAFRSYLFSQASVKRLHQVWVENGEEGLRATVKKIIIS
ncbi:twin-arginine translocation signal domain-containing protein [Azotosporobacter soli]|uniref:twin-arginine translocation signal domain-containing protein n=1 Tax=Azotosporobacter soli TaxID=3055040 RepID=UPI0031FF20C3